MYTTRLILRLLRFVRLPGINNLFIPGSRWAYDFYHEARGMGSRVDTSALLQPLRGNMDLLGLVHIANVPGRHTPNIGEIRYSDIYSALRKEGYRGWMAMEFLPVGDAKTELQQAEAKVV